MKADTLSVTEIFHSIQGESTWVGTPCTFIRLARCHLRCAWCDTIYSFAKGADLTVTQILEEVEIADLSIVEVTGGEPLLQKAVYPLLEALLRRNRHVLLETSGTLDISKVPQQVHRIVDMKPPSSGHVDDNLYGNIDLLTGRDELKIVLLDRLDYEWARDLIQSRPVCKLARAVIFSPVYGQLDPAQLADWVIEDKLEARVGLQLHKLIWPGIERGK